MNPHALARAGALLIPAAIGAGLLLTSTITFTETAWKFDVKRMLELAFLPLIFALVVAQPGLRHAFAQQVGRTPRVLAVMLLAVLALGIVSSVRNAAGAMSLLYSLADVALLALLVTGLFAIAACRAVAGPHFDRAMLLLLAVVGIAVGLQELVGVAAALASGVEFHPRIALLHFSWPRFYNQVQAWSMPVVAALPLLFPGKPLARVLAIAALALNWYVLIATGARGTTLSVIVAVPLLLALLPAGRRHIAVNHLAGLGAGALIYLAVLMAHSGLHQPDAATQQAAISEQPAQPATQRPADTSGKFTEPLSMKRMKTSSGRIRIWQGTLREALARPWLGNGPMNFACRGPTYREGHPHNAALQFLHEWGMPATLLVLIVVLLTGTRAFASLRALQGGDASHAALTNAVGAGVLAAALLSGVDGVLVMPASQMTGLLVAGWLLGLSGVSGNGVSGNGVRVKIPVRSGGTVRSRWRNFYSDPISTDPISIPISTVLIAALVVSVALLSFALHEFAVAAERLEQTERMDRLIPRFWQNGKVCKLYQ